MPLSCVNPGLKHTVIALRTVKAGVLDTTPYIPNHGECPALQGHGTRAATSFRMHTEAGKVERQANGPGAVASLEGSGFTTVDPPRSRCLGYGRGEKMALEKTVV